MVTIDIVDRAAGERAVAAGKLRGGPHGFLPHHQRVRGGRQPRVGRSIQGQSGLLRGLQAGVPFRRPGHAPAVHADRGPRRRHCKGGVTAPATQSQSLKVYRVIFLFLLFVGGYFFFI